MGAILGWNFLRIRVVLCSVVGNAAKSPEGCFERREGQVPERDSSVNDLLDDRVQVLVLLGMEVVDVACQSTRVSKCVLPGYDILLGIAFLSEFNIAWEPLHIVSLTI